MGLATTHLGTQAEFLRHWLSPKMLANVKREAALAYLLDPEGAGGAFKVLEQRR